MAKKIRAARGRAAEMPGAYAVLDGISDKAANLTGYRFRSGERAARARQALLAEHPGAVLSYLPTKAERAKWDELRRRVRAFELTYWQIGLSLEAPALSPMYRSREQALRVLAATRQRIPDAKLLEYRQHFHPDRPEHVRERAALLAAMAPLLHERGSAGGKRG